jgi:hypothetical protein
MPAHWKRRLNGDPIMSKLACILTFAALAVLPALPAASQTAIPDLRGTWKGESESLVLGGGNPHHPSTAASEPELRSVPFTLTIDKQEAVASPAHFPRRAAARKSLPSFRAAARSFWPTTKAIPTGRCWRRTGWSSAICMFHPPRELHPARS